MSNTIAAFADARFGDDDVRVGRKPVSMMESAAEMATENNGEIPEELRQALLDYFEAFGTKVDNIAKHIKSQENQARNAKPRSTGSILGWLQPKTELIV